MLSEIDSSFTENGAASETFSRLQQHLMDNALVPDQTSFTLGSVLSFDSKTKQFIGSNAAEANALMTRPIREPFVIPEKV